MRGSFLDVEASTGYTGVSTVARRGFQHKLSGNQSRLLITSPDYSAGPNERSLARSDSLAYNGAEL